MKLKKQHSEYLVKFSSSILFFVLVLLSTAVSSQKAEVTLLNGPAAEEGLQTATFRITFKKPIVTDVAINYSLTGSAIEGEDYENVGNVVVPGFSNFVDVTITPIEDTSIEGDTDVIFTILPGSYNVGKTNQATTFIEENDFGIVTLIATLPEAKEQGPINGAFQIQLSGPNETGSPLFVLGEFSGDATQGAGQDYTITGNGTFTNTTQVAKNITIIPVDDTEKEATETVTLTLTATNNSWFVLGTAAEITADVTIEDNDCSAGTTAPRINKNIPIALCDEPSTNLGNYIDVAGPSAPPGSALRWSLTPNPTASSDLIAATVSTSDTYYGVFWDNLNACASPALEVALSFNNSPSAGTITNASACNNADPAFMPRIIDLDDLIADADAGEWTQTGGPTVEAIPSDNTINFDNRAPGVYEFTYTTTGAVAPCTNTSSVLMITVSNCDPCSAGNLAPEINTNVPTVFCDNINVSLNQYTNSTPPNGTTLEWTTVNNPEDPNAVFLSDNQIANPAPGAYFGFFWDDTNSCASPTLRVNLVRNTSPEIVASNTVERCGTGLVTLMASATNNATINWFAGETSISILGSGANFTRNISQTTTFWVEATLNDCVSERVQHIATVFPQPSAGTPQNDGIASACSDQANGPTIIDLDDLILGEDTGNWVLTSGPPGENVTIPSNSIIDFEDRDDGEYVFTFTTSGAAAPCTNESSVITISVNDCDVDTDLDGLFDGIEATLGTNPNSTDSDGDGINDNEEVGDTENPLNEDGDEFIDALDSNILDTDNDGVVDQADPANDNPCIPNTLNGICDSDGDGITDSDENTNGSDPLNPCDPDAENAACNAEVDLEVVKTVDNFNGLIGDTVVFTITVNNLSANRASSIIIGDLLESGFKYVSHSPDVAQYDFITGEWAIPLIEGSNTEVLEITVNILESGVYSNTAELLAVFQTDINTENDRSETITLPIELPEGIDLVLEKTALSPNPLIGEEVIFTLKVTNASIDEQPVMNIEVEDIITNDSGFNYIDHNTLFGDYDAGTGIWSIESLDRNQEATLEIRVSVPNEGTFTNTALIKRSSPADSNPNNNEATAEVVVSIPTPADVGFLFNQFSPNGDGTNDILRINTVNRETNLENPIIYNIQIFNRYGNLVFEANNKTDNEVWDGTWKGKDAPDGTYFYTMSIDVGGNSELKKGWIQLIR